jgi:hypothetical protein
VFGGDGVVAYEIEIAFGRSGVPGPLLAGDQRFVRDVLMHHAGGVAGLHDSSVSTGHVLLLEMISISAGSTSPHLGRAHDPPSDMSASGGALLLVDEPHDP